MRSWPLQEARAHLRDVIDGALESGPQRITRYGKQAVIVISESEWERRSAVRRSFGELLANSPLSASDLPPRLPLRASRDNGFE
ncbi:MAG TPA: type II toxin-antitoxin system Phd/YefM family antitoxin [Acetobacteraceae bacterium]|nr:type II toxin-antitoxin system Phd/YefM family antitoxin [Acetobacteraceae bacterium]